MLKTSGGSRSALGRFALAICICILMCGASVAKAETVVTDEQGFINAINSTETVIVVANDITLTREYQITRDLTIKSSSGATLTWGGTPYTKTFTVENNVHFTLEDIALDGNGIYVILVKVYGATFSMNDGTVLKNVLGSSAGKAVLIGDGLAPEVGGTFNMNGGLITGVSIDSPVLCYYGTINMSGNASISENEAPAISMIGAALNMTGNAAISNNTTSRTGAGVLAGAKSVINMGLYEGDTPHISGNTSTSNYGGGLHLDQSSLNVGASAWISNNTAETMGGGVLLNRSTLTMHGNARVSGNTSRQGVGGGIFATRSTVHLTDNAAVFGNAVMADDGRGGGIYLQSTPSLLTIADAAAVYDNKAAYGAGIFLHVETEMQMSGGAVRDNVANLDGGGVYICGKATISGGVADGNRTVNGNGGGVYLTGEGIAAISAAAVTNNLAPNGNGGGIYSEISPDFTNLSTDNGTWFYGNRASVAYTPPEDALALYPHIRFASTSIADHPLNHYDINFTDSEVLLFDVTCENNGGEGHYVGSPTAPSHTVRIRSAEEVGITRNGFVFSGWNTEPDGSGQSYRPGDTMVLNHNLTLYAQWNAGLAWLWVLLLALILGFVLLMTYCYANRRKCCCGKQGW